MGNYPSSQATGQKQQPAAGAIKQQPQNQSPQKRPAQQQKQTATVQQEPQIQSIQARLGLEDPQNLLDLFGCLTQNYQLYTIALFECFRQADVGEDSFIKLRNNVVIDMQNYIKFVVPIIKGIFETVRDLGDYEENLCTTPQQQLAKNPKILSMLKKIVNGMKYLQEVHGIVLDQAYIRKIEAEQTINQLNHQKQEYAQQIQFLKQTIEQQQATQKKSTSFYSYIPFASTLVDKASTVFASSKVQHQLFEHKHNIDMKQEIMQNIVYAINVIDKALLPSIKNYMESFEQLLKAFRVLLKASEFVANEQTPLHYQELRANDIYNYLYPISQKLVQQTLNISGNFATSESYFRAMQIILFDQNYIQQWDAAFQREQEDFMQEIIKKEAEFYKVLELEQLKLPQNIKILEQKRNTQNNAQENTANAQMDEEEY